jgi:hypothetical protein
VSGDILASVGHVLGIPASRIQATAPMTANVPRTLIEPGSGGKATDLLASPDKYKLEVQADPSVPVLHVYTQAPTAAAAIRFARAAVDAVRTYMQASQSASDVAPGQRIRVQQLGPVQGGVANPGAPIEIVILVFAGVFGVTLWVATIAEQIRRGWISARLDEQLQL